jgi:AcrR family transcriptional regulator
MKRYPSPMSPPRRPYHHGDLRRTLLDASLELMEAEGLGALSLREVARRAGVTHQAPYHHFADKGALVAAIVAEGFGLLRDEMLRQRARAGPGAAARLAAIGVGYVGFALQHPAHFRVMFRPELTATVTSPEHREVTTEAYRLLEESVAACVDEGLASRSDQQALVLLSWSLVHGLAALWLDGPLASSPDSAPVEPRALAQAVLGLFSRMLGAPRTSSRRGKTRG